MGKKACRLQFLDCSRFDLAAKFANLEIKHDIIFTVTTFTIITTNIIIFIVSPVYQKKVIMEVGRGRRPGDPLGARFLDSPLPPPHYIIIIIVVVVIVLIIIILEHLASTHFIIIVFCPPSPHWSKLPTLTQNKFKGSPNEFTKPFQCLIHHKTLLLIIGSSVCVGESIRLGICILEQALAV